VGCGEREQVAAIRGATLCEVMDALDSAATHYGHVNMNSVPRSMQSSHADMNESTRAFVSTVQGCVEGGT
jgi:hypothetical protein